MEEEEGHWSPVIQSYRDLRVWQDALSLAESCYAATAAFPRAETFGMTAQIRRSAASIAANIAEGHGRESTASFMHFLRVAQGSRKELDTHLILSERVGLSLSSDCSPVLETCGVLGRRLRALIRSLQQRGREAKG